MAIRTKAVEIYDRIKADLDSRKADELLTVADTARLLGITRTYLDTLRAKGAGPIYVRLGKKLVRYRFCDVVMWVSRQAEVRAKPILIRRFDLET